MPSPIEISVVVPLFNEQENVRELHARLDTALTALGITYEILFVDDGSGDDTPRLLAELQQHNPRLLTVTLSRNFGHQAAVSAGSDLARGDAVIIMDGDLQDPPEVLGQFIHAWRQGGDVVYAVRTCRKEGIVKRICYAAFYRLLRRISSIDIPLDSGDFGLMDRKVVDVLRQLPEKERFVRGLRAFAGFRQVGLRYERAARLAGQSKYTFSKMVRLAFDGLLNFSDLPLRLVAWIGSLLLVITLVVAAAITGTCVLQATLPAGWQIVCVTVLFSGAMQLLGLGLVGAYVQRIFREVKGRPTYVVKEVKGQTLAGPHFGVLRRAEKQRAAG